jgi:hypothetical protein
MIQRHVLQVGHERAQHRPGQICVAACDIAADAGLLTNGGERAGVVAISPSRRSICRGQALLDHRHQLFSMRQIPIR